ncbi:hypothetical protein BOX15_Mlig014920g1 [Macrostomum lignano]|uniref:Dynamin-type G domain-containing protein n=2 Tax=Macrostomum lignano TaxID=282301 RepID=A0A1I8I1U8_9PLAT|nr:hypothetical protein BOX15_Mlig014920g1 [Macrostomum lignano]
MFKPSGSSDEFGSSMRGLKGSRTPGLRLSARPSRRPSGSSSSNAGELSIAGPAWIVRGQEVVKDEPAKVIKYPELHSDLARSYNEQIKPCYDQIAKLRALGFAKELRLPSIVVIGDQSTGKSSVLESISGVRFPRGNGVVTLCPLQLSMRTSDDGKWRGNIRYYDTYGKLMKWDIDGPEDVEDAIQEAQMRITGNQRNVSKSIIEMTLESPELPNLTLIDLPGIARYNHNSAESGASLHQLTTDIIKEYIRREETIILVVIPLTSDTATMEALQLAKDADPYGMRTIGVLTFPDLVNKGAQEEKLMIARNITYPLSKGYVTVKCRNQEDIKNRKSLKDAKADEALFFNTDPFFKQLDSMYRGSDTLARRLSEELLYLVKKFIPELISDVQSVRERLGQELAQMGKGPPEDDRSKVALIARMFNDFTKLFEKEASGKSHNFQEDSGKKNLHQRCRQHWCHLAEQMEKTVRQIGDDDAKIRKAVRDFLDDQRGRELPNFQSAYPVIECIIRQRLVAPLRQLAMHCLRDVSVEVDDTLRDLADSVFTSYPRLDQYVKESVQGIKERMYSRAKDDLDRQFDQESYVWTSDLTFDDESNRREATRSLVMNVMVLPNRNMYSFTEQFNRQSVEWIADHCCRPEDESNTEFAAWFQGIFQQYFSQSSASQDEKASGPKSPRDADHEPDEAIERCLNSLHAYMKIAFTRMIDNAPLCMMHFMLYKLADELCNEVSIFQQESEKLDQLLEEKEGIRIHRIETKNRLKALAEAENDLCRISL